MTIPEIGKDIKWVDIIGQVFRVLEFDKTGTRIEPGDKVKASSIFKPYGFLLVESPILNQAVRLPITHKDDFILASTVYDEPSLVERIQQRDELLVTYVPKKKHFMGFGGISHALHYVITPRGTLEEYYSFDNDVHMAKPSPEKLFDLVWKGMIRVKVNPNPDIK